MTDKIEEIRKGDDTGAYGNRFITINLNNPNEYIVSKAIFVCGSIQKPFINPVFPLTVNLNSQETEKLRASNVCYLVTFDELGRQKTCKGTLTFPAQNGVINNGGRICC